MFGKNKIMVPNSYREEPNGTLRITTIFYTLQGEGVYQGIPAVFVRLQGCNLRCSFCDTFFDAGDRLTYDEILSKAEEIKNKFYTDRNIILPDNLIKSQLLVVTGGEPLNQKNLTDFLHAAHKKGYRTQIESNGTIYRDIPEETHLVLSPKINESTGKFIKVNDALLNRANTLKFVVSKTMLGYTDLPDFAVSWFNVGLGRELFVSPMNCYVTEPIKVAADGTLEKRSEEDERISFWTPNLLDLQKNKENHEHAALLAMKYGCRLNLQMQLYANLP
jgi:7-carboxy-7-deazaguanine synthase